MSKLHKYVLARLTSGGEVSDFKETTTLWPCRKFKPLPPATHSPQGGWMVKFHSCLGHINNHSALARTRVPCLRGMDLNLRKNEILKTRSEKLSVTRLPDQVAQDFLQICQTNSEASFCFSRIVARLRCTIGGQTPGTYIPNHSLDISPFWPDRRSITLHHWVANSWYPRLCRPMLQRDRASILPKRGDV